MYEEIKTYFESEKIPKFRFKQLEQAAFKEFVSNFNEITVFPKTLREQLTNKFTFSSLELVETHKANQTIKFLFKTQDKQFIESVLMLHNDSRKTVCVSCQIFCAVGCTFCATGANKFSRSLSSTEIIEQVLFVERYLKKNDEKVTNVVFMGQGEPFLAYKTICETITVLKEKIGIGARHITVSTSGIIPRIYDFAKSELKTRLAISLHASNDKLRSELMPLNRVYPLKDLIKACDTFVKETNKRITYEYVLLGGVNDTPKHAKELAVLLKGKLAHVNLLIYNPHEFAKYVKPEKYDVLKFRDILDEEGIEVSIRKSMGDDISGACGQLSSKEIRKKGYEKEFLEKSL